jgi:hypothetical protein
MATIGDIRATEDAAKAVEAEAVTTAFESSNSVTVTGEIVPEELDFSQAILEAALNAIDMTRDSILKVADTAPDAIRYVELRPPIRRVPNENPFFVEMLGVNGGDLSPCAIEFPNGTVVRALKLSPNPDTLSISSGKIVNKYNTMTRWVEEHWGDDMDTISFSGSTFSFMTLDPGGPAEGLTVINRRDTNSFLMLKELVRFFRVNGCIIQDSKSYSDNLNSGLLTSSGVVQAGNTVESFLLDNPNFIGHHPRDGMIKERLYVKVTFDFVSFIGYFESFDLIEDAANPYRLTYNAAFKSEKTTYVLG